MKKIFKSLLLALIMLPIMTFTGCKKDVSPGDPPVNNPNPIAPGAPNLKITPSQTSPLWYKGSITMTIETNGTTISLNERPQIGNVLTLADLLRDTILVFKATITDPVTHLTSVATIKTVTIHVYSQSRTLLCKDKTWYLSYYSYQRVAPTIGPLSVSTDLGCDKYNFHPTDTMFVWKGICTPTPGVTYWDFYNLTNNDQTLNWRQCAFTISELSNDVLKIEVTKQAIGDTTQYFHFVEIYHHE